jgi:hypothetical protein
MSPNFLSSGSEEGSELGIEPLSAYSSYDTNLTLIKERCVIQSNIQVHRMKCDCLKKQLDFTRMAGYV